jgi:DNA-binding response OmpR family regulator
MKKIIISDDLHSLVTNGKNILSRDDIKIFTASTGEKILRIHGMEKVDLIITGLDIRGLNGDMVCSAIRKDSELRKVSILLACDDDKSAIAKCQACGANAFITKPVDKGELLRKILKFLNVTERVSLRVILNVGVRIDVKYDFFFANSENISSSGILFVTDRELSEGDKITCSFFIGKTLISSNGIIVRIVKKSSNELYCGMRFENLPQLSKSKIEKFVKKFMKGK